MQGFGFRVEVLDKGLRVWSLGFKVQGSEFGV